MQTKNNTAEINSSRFFYGWIIVAIATLALLVSNGLSINGISIFYKSVQEDMVASGAIPKDKIQSIYALGPSLTFLLSGFIAPFAAFLLQKLQARRMMIIGCFILGAGILVYSQAAAAPMIYLAHILLGTSLCFVGVLVTTTLTSDWFRRKRGLALGIVLTGSSLGGVLIPQISAPLIQNYGWRWAMIAVSLIIWLILLPAILLFVKNRPSEIGLLHDGEKNLANEESKTQNPKSASGMTLSEALKTPVFWIFSLCAALIFYAIFVVSQQLNLYLQSPKIGFTREQASNVQSLLFGLSVLGKFLYGFLSDRFSAARVMLISAVMMFASTLVFFYFNGQTVYIFAALFGLNYGGTFVILQLLVADYFGLKEYGKVLGAVMVIETIGGALGTMITGRIADAYGGDFTVAFYGLVLVTALALLTVFLLNIFSEKRNFRLDA